jgi:uncharacterized protein with HEPN domain
MPPDDRDRLFHMLEAAREAVQFLEGRDAVAVRSDRMRALAIVKSIEVIGEAASKVGAEMRTRHPEIPWEEAKRMRNRLVHGYYDVDAQRVVDTVRGNVATLIPVLEAALAAEGG